MGFITSPCNPTPFPPFAKIARQSTRIQGPISFARNWDDGSTAGATYYTATVSVVAQRLNIAQTGVVGTTFGRASYENQATRATDLVADVDFLFPGDGVTGQGEAVLFWWRVGAGLGGTNTLPSGYTMAISTPAAGTKDVRLQIWPAGTILASAAIAGYVVGSLAHMRVVSTGTSHTVTFSGGGVAAPITLGPTINATYSEGRFGLASITSTGGAPVASRFDNLAVTYYQNC